MNDHCCRLFVSSVFITILIIKIVFFRPRVTEPHRRVSKLKEGIPANLTPHALLKKTHHRSRSDASALHSRTAPSKSMFLSEFFSYFTPFCTAGSALPFLSCNKLFFYLFFSKIKLNLRH